MRFMSFSVLPVNGDTWLTFLQNLVNLGDKSKSVLALCFVQVYCYHIWRDLVLMT